ncbi:uncharacterized protein BCR38DRAFT_412060 [Pseudomassariella vexata]|uniref:Uncharacterized protein n=1 Tax=Pseudomassariella vexata TaxID=1141098 RepID=A0A1Y2DP29_9PEZI|nr:uncharacterized protein BCR38DRAFT_412060 [Pseudomassariella vexata]ORY60957.1 hypothetical protein BCR38DRAFT_412060 [Pseudomassariella vexata]
MGEIVHTKVCGEETRQRSQLEKRMPTDSVWEIAQISQHTLSTTQIKHPLIRAVPPRCPQNEVGLRRTPDAQKPTGREKKSRKFNDAEKSTFGSDKGNSEDEFENREPERDYGKDEDDQVNEDELQTQYDEQIASKDSITLKPLRTSRPLMITEYYRKPSESFVSLLTLVPLLTLDISSVFDIEFRKTRDEKVLNQLWAAVAAIAHWLYLEEPGPWMAIDDGDRMNATVGLIGKAFVSALNDLDRSGMLKSDSATKVRGLVMSVCLEWLEGLDDYGVDEELAWRKEIVVYAKKADINLERTITTASEKYGKIGGDHHNIMKMSRKERASYAFNKKHPLAQFSEKRIRNGNLIPGWYYLI